MEIQIIRYSSHFERSLRKLSATLKKTVNNRITIFRKNCFDPRLQTHKLLGKLKNYWSFSLTRSHRVLFQFRGKSSVDFIDIGDHSIYQ